MAAGLNYDVLKRNAIAYWQQGGGNRLVKVTSLARQPAFWVDGYITCYKFIAGRSLPEVERILGLMAGELAGGAYLQEFQRLPTHDEFETRGYTQTPDGRPWAPGGYPIGAGAAQWQIRKDAYIPSRVVLVIESGQLVP